MVSRQGVTLWQLGGYPLVLNWSWFFFIALVCLMWPAFLGVYLLSFFFVTVHEYAHAVTAQWLGHKVHSICLWPLGGIARLDMQSMNPWHELFIIAAGPLSNVLMALTALPLAFLNLPGVAGTIVNYTVIINVVLAVFNMLPAFPMDGGRVLRAGLAVWRGDIVWATKVAVFVGHFIAGMFLYLGLVAGSLMWCIMAAFIFVAGLIELEQLKRVALRPIFRKRLAELHGDDTLLECPDDELLAATFRLPEPEKSDMFRMLLRAYPELLEPAPENEEKDE